MCGRSLKFVPWLLTEEQKQQQFLAAKNMAVVSHPPYSPDLAPCDFFRFPRMKLHHFQNVPEIQQQSDSYNQKVYTSSAISSGRNAGPIA